MVRFSCEEDKDELQSLVDCCFPIEQIEDILPVNINGKYLLFISDSKIVAMSGLDFSEKGKIKLNWTCVHKDYMQRECIQVLFTRLTILTDEDIYCDCSKVSSTVYGRIKEWALCTNFKCCCTDFGYNCSQYKGSEE